MPNYTTAKAAAYLAEHGYTVRSKRDGTNKPPPADTIKHWCIDGKLPGAEKHGRDWSIPKEALDRLIEGVKTMNVEIIMLEEDIENSTMRAVLHFPQPIEVERGVFQHSKRIGIFPRGDFAAVRAVVEDHRAMLFDIKSILLQMDWYGGRDAFTPEEQEAFKAAFDGMETVIHAG